MIFLRTMIFLLYLVTLPLFGVYVKLFSKTFAGLRLMAGAE